jgi:hypothetical protein
MSLEVEKVEFNNLKKGKKYQIRNKTGTFWEYKQIFEEPHASFFERDEDDVMVKHSYPPHYEYYRILSLEEIHAKRIKFNIFEKTHYDDLKKDEIYKFDTYDATFRFKFGHFAVFREVIFYENDCIYNTRDHDSNETYYRYVSEEEYRKKRRDKFNENALKTVLRNILDEYFL